jgi:hypothetical protein
MSNCSFWPENVGSALEDLSKTIGITGKFRAIHPDRQGFPCLSPLGIHETIHRTFYAFVCIEYLPVWQVFNERHADT